MKKTIGAVERLFPMPCPLVVGGTLDRADALAVAWINIMASTPPTIAPTSDIRVRRAINYAIDRDGINKAIFGGTAIPIAFFAFQPVFLMLGNA